MSTEKFLPSDLVARTTFPKAPEPLIMPTSNPKAGNTGNQDTTKPPPRMR